MQIAQDIAKKHGLRCLLHEKPFAGVNGSGKHDNWSVILIQESTYLIQEKILKKINHS